MSKETIAIKLEASAIAELDRLVEEHVETLEKRSLSIWKEKIWKLMVLDV